MCGICGIYGKSSPGALERMIEALVHRGPDSAGDYITDRVQLGMRRLKIIDLEGSEQPITNESGSVVVVCNGEIYNYRSLRAQLEDRGHRFSTNGDVETIVHLYEEYGSDCVRYLDGMFAFAIWDQELQRLIIARDRLGVKPLYFARLPNQLVFASEIRSILASGEVDPIVDDLAVLNFIRFPAIPAPLTIFQQIQMLKPGHFLSYSAEKVELIEYWDVDFQKSASIQYTPQESVEVIRHQLEESVKKRLISDVSLGAFLSGGIDSSAIVGLMGSMLQTPIKTFSIKFTGSNQSYDWFDDASYASKVAEAYGTDHTELVITGKEIIEQLLRAVWAMDQPSGDALQYYMVSGHAAREVTVALSGTGGDEVFAGYEWFKEIRRIEQIHEKMGFLKPELAEMLLKRLSRIKRGPELSKIRSKFRTLLAGRRDFETRYMLNRRLYFEEDCFYLFSPEFIARSIDTWNLPEPGLKKSAERCEGLDPVTRMSYLQLKHDMSNLLVRDQDAVSMAHSLEVRLPMIDYQLVEAASRVPSSMKLRGDTEKYVLREAVKDLLPDSVTRRKKKGFIFPMDDWMRNELKPVILSCLSKDSVKRRGIFNPDTVASLVADFYKGKQPFFKIWNLALFELWYRIVIDRENGWEEPGGTIEDYL